MRTYEVEMIITRFEKVLVEAKNLEDAHHQARAKTGTCEGEYARVWKTEDVTPKEPTDKDRFNDAFKALRKMGYAAKQNQSRSLPEYPERHVMTMKEDADWAFSGGELARTLMIHWDSDNIRLANVDGIMQVFKDHGFDVKWGGRFWDCIEIRKGVEA